MVPTFNGNKLSNVRAARKSCLEGIYRREGEEEEEGEEGLL